MLKPYEHVQQLNLSKNEIQDISTVNFFNYLLVLDANTNHIKSMAFFEENPEALQFLQVSISFINFVTDLILFRELT